MDTGEYVKLIFSKMICSQCNMPFDENGIEIIRIEGNCAIVKITCSHCHRDYGIAVIGIEHVSMDDIPEGAEFSDLPPINTDDVIEAHNFFSNLGSDWMKYLPHNEEK